MAKKNSYNGLSLFFGLTFLSPIIFSIVAYEMDVVQRMFFFSISFILYGLLFLKYKVSQEIEFNKYLTFLWFFFPFTFLTSLLNGSGSYLFLKLSDLIIPISILLQTATMFAILGEEKFFKTVSYCVVIISTLFSLVGLLEVFETNIIQLPSVRPPGSFLGHRGFAAEYLLSALPFFLILENYLKKERKKILLVASVINVSFLLFTRSRAGILILTVASILYLIFIVIRCKRPERLSKIIPVLTVLVSSFLISLIPVKIGERPDLKSATETFFDEDYRSNLLRLNFWEASIEMIKEKPVTGIGLYKWSGIYPKYSDDYYNDENLFFVHAIHAHNDFLETFAESGIVASVIFILIYLTIAIILFRKSLADPKYFILLLTILITFAFSFVSFPNYKFASYFLSAVVSGIAVVTLTQNRVKRIKIKPKYLGWVLFTLIVSGGVTSYIRLKSELNYGQAIFLKDRRQYFMMQQKLNGISELLYPLDAAKQPVDYYRGIANSYLGNHSDALKDNLSAQQIAPFNPIVMRNVAASYRALKDLNSSIKQFEKVYAYFPNYISSHLNLFELYIETGQTEKAKTLYKKLSNKKPGDPRIMKYKSLFDL